MAGKIQGIRFLYGELRNVVGDKKVIPYHMQVVARTFDALDNSLLTLYNAQKVAQTQNNFAFTRVTFFCSLLSAGFASSHVRIPSINDSNGVPQNYIPISADINAAFIGSGDTLFDWQVSVDDINWSSILTSFIKLPATLSFAPTTTAQFIAGPVLKANQWTRLIVAPGSDLTAQVINIEFGVIPG